MVSVELGAMFAILVFLSVLGLPIGLALISSGVFYLIVSGQDLSIAAESMLSGLFSTFIVLAIPLFIFAARIMNEGKITDRLLDLCAALVGRYRGGLAQVNVASSLVFSGMSGAATADVAGLGHVLIKMMTANDRYPAGFAAAVTASSATIGPVFPPSIPMIFYALISSTSVGALFLGGIIPGIFLAAVLMTTVAIIARRRNFPVEARVPLKAMPAIFGKAVLPLLMPIILLGGIYSGVFTPTESAAVAAVYAIGLCTIVYRSLGLQKFYKILVDTAKLTSIVGVVIVGAFLFSYIVAIEDVPSRLAEWLNGLDVSATTFLVTLNLILILLGAVLAAETIMLVIIPLVLPAVAALGIDPVHFGVVVAVNVTIGLVTPPYGVLLFVLSGLTGIKIAEIMREIWVFIVVLVAALFVVVLLPDMSLWLPRQFGY